MSSTATVPTTCATCKAKGTLHVSQALTNANLTYTERFSCKCGHGFEANEKGLPPPVLREALLKLGQYEVQLTQAEGRQAALKIMNALMGTSEAEAAKQLKKLPAAMYLGTQVECEFVAEAMKRLGAATRVQALK